MSDARPFTAYATPVPLPAGRTSAAGVARTMRENALGLFAPEAFDDDVVYRRFLGRQQIILNRPAGIHRILVENTENYRRTAAGIRILRPFLEGYRVVADSLVARGGDASVDESAFLARCLSLGKQYRLQGRISNAESVSKVLFETALRLARNRGLLDPDVPNLAERRRAFAEEINAAIRRVDIIDALAASRRAGLID